LMIGYIMQSVLLKLQHLRIFSSTLLAASCFITNIASTTAHYISHLLTKSNIEGEQLSDFS